MFDRIKAAKQQEEQEAAEVPKLSMIDKMELILREALADFGSNEQRVISLPLRLAEAVKEINSVVVAVGEYERAQGSRKATPYGLEMAESIHALLDHIEETVQLLREKYPEMKETAK